MLLEKRKETRQRSRKENWDLEGKREEMKKKVKMRGDFRKYANTFSVLSFTICVAGYRWTQFSQ